MINLYFPKNSDFLTTQCPFCGTSHTVTKTDVKDFDERKVVRFECTCDCAFHQRICQKNPREIGLIAALISLDFEVIRYKLRYPLASFSS